MIEVIEIDSLMWAEKFSADAHKIAFGQLKNPGDERIDFALLAVRDNTPLGYVTCRELDAKAVY